MNAPQEFGKSRRVLHHKGKKFTVTVWSTNNGEHFVRSIQHYGFPRAVGSLDAPFSDLEEAFEIAEDEGRATIDAR